MPARPCYVDGVNPGDRSGSKRYLVRQTCLLLRRSDHHQFAHIGYPSRNGGHQQSAGQGGCAARDIDADALYGPHELADCAFFVVLKPALIGLAAVKVFYTFRRQDQRLVDFWRDVTGLLQYGLRIDAQVVQTDTIQFLGPLAHSGVATGTYVGQYTADGFIRADAGTEYVFNAVQNLFRQVECIPRLAPEN